MRFNMLIQIKDIIKEMIAKLEYAAEVQDGYARRETDQEGAAAKAFRETRDNYLKQAKVLKGALIRL